MTGRELALRLASGLIRRSCRSLPDGVRDERLREWGAELAAILDEAGGWRMRRYARAVRFAAGTRRAVRRMTRPARPRRLRVRAVRAAAAAAVAAVVLMAASLAVDYGFSHSSATAAVVIWLGLLGVAAGVACAVLLAGVGLARVAQGKGGRSAAGVTGLGRLRTRPARIAAAAFFTAVICLTAAIVTGTSSQAQFHGHFLLSWFADVMGVTGLACIALLVGLALVTATARLWHLRRHAPTILPGRGHKADRPQP